jgi:hypothetical protein
MAPNEIKIFGKGCGGNDTRSYDTTNDAKIFIFNAAFRQARDSGTIARYWSDTIQVKYTTSQNIFLIAGLFGVFLGFVAKTLSQNRTRKTDNATRGQDQTKITLWSQVKEQIPYLLTSLLIGLGALLGIASAGVPAGGFTTAVALGIGIGVLSDDAVIAKLQSTPNR